MALVSCCECEKELSNKAKICPNCGAITEYGKESKKKCWKVILLIISITIAIIACDQTALLKQCDDDDEKRGNICVKKHYSDALSKQECSISGMYVKDGRCWTNSGIKAGIPKTVYYCNEGYLDDNGLLHECVVETTYNAYYKFN